MRVTTTSAIVIVAQLEQEEQYRTYLVVRELNDDGAIGQHADQQTLRDADQLVAEAQLRAREHHEPPLARWSLHHSSMQLAVLSQPLRWIGVIEWPMARDTSGRSQTRYIQRVIEIDCGIGWYSRRTSCWCLRQCLGTRGRLGLETIVIGHGPRGVIEHRDHDRRSHSGEMRRHVHESHRSDQHHGHQHHDQPRLIRRRTPRRAT